MNARLLTSAALLALLALAACASVDAPSTSNADADDVAEDAAQGADDVAPRADADDDADEAHDADLPDDATNPDATDTDEDDAPLNIDDVAPDAAPDVEEDTAPDAEDDLPLPNVPPNAVTADSLIGNVGQPIAFDGATSADPDGELVAWDWDFGDGELGQGERTEHTYAAIGTFHGLLTVTDDDGDTDTAAFTAQIIDPADTAPVAVIHVDPELGQVGQPVSLSATSSFDPNGTLVAWTWRLSDGLSEPIVLDGEQVEWTFDGAGTWELTLVVTDDEGLVGEVSVDLRVGAPPVAVITPPEAPWRVGAPVTFDGSASTDADGQLVRWQWDFGDGQTAEGATVTHTFATAGLATITLTVTDDDGFTHAATLDLPVGVDNQAPIADAGPDIFADVGLVRFDATRSSDPDGVVTAWSWDFGDGQSDTGATPAHAYTAGGVYTVTLTVTDALGAMGVDTLVATISAPNHPPTTDAGPDLAALVNEVVRLDGAGSDPDGSITAWRWDFGDGQSADGQSVFHAWTAAGAFIATLTVTDNSGAQASDTRLVTVTRPNLPPVASFTALPSPGTAGLPVRLDASGSTDPDGDAIVSQVWRFGDNTPDGAGLTVDHTWLTPNTYTVELLITDARGATATTSSLVTIEPPAASYEGLYRLRPLDQEAPIDDFCGDFSVTISPSTCNTTIAGSAIVMDCGDDTYRGTITGDTFSVTLDYNPVYVDGLCGNAWWEETVDGSWVSADRWEGTSNLALRTTNPFWCSGCSYLPFVKTGTRL